MNLSLYSDNGRNKTKTINKQMNPIGQRAGFQHILGGLLMKKNHFVCNLIFIEMSFVLSSRFEIFYSIHNGNSHLLLIFR